MPPIRHDVREERRGLALDGGGVVLLGAGHVEEVLELEHLAPAQLADRVGEERGDVGAERCGERRGAGEQVVAGEDRHDVGPAGVDARHAAARLGLVDDVVVVQRAEVDELARDAAGDHVVADRRVAAGRGVGGAEGEGRADALAAGRDEVRADLAEEAVGVAHRARERVLDPVEIAGERRERERLGRPHARHATARPRRSPSLARRRRRPNREQIGRRAC